MRCNVWWKLSNAHYYKREIWFVN